VGNGAGNGTQNGAPGNGSNEAASRQAAGVLGIESLPSTATAPASLALLGTTLGVAGLLLLRQSRRKN
jgi:LPXTG-motif cell wall-anchored protein